MAVMAVPLMVMGTAMSVMSSFQAADAAEKAGKAQQAAADRQAVLQKQAAGQEKASAQRAAIAEKKKADLVTSSARAIAAAGGGDLADPGLVKVIGDIDAEGEYRKLAALYQGNQRAYDLERGAEFSTYGGQVARFSGKQQAKAYRMQGIATGLQNAGGSLMMKYGGGSFSSAADGGSGSMGGLNYNDFLDDPAAW